MGKYEIPDIESSLVKEAAVSYSLSRDDMAAILGVSEKTYYNMLQKSTLDVDRSDRFQFVNQILESGEEALGSKDNLSKWLKTAQPTLGGYVPIDMMRSINGAQKVLNMLGRIKHGVTA